MNTRPRRERKGWIIIAIYIVVSVICVGVIINAAWRSRSSNARTGDSLGSTDTSAEITSAPTVETVLTDTDCARDSSVGITSEVYTETTTEFVIEPEPEPIIELDWLEVLYIARAISGEGGTGQFERSAVAWCILNRVDSSRFSNTVIGVVTAANQFHLNYVVYDGDFQLAADVLTRWKQEKMGETDVGRTLPSGYYYFRGFKWAARANELGMARPTKSHNWFFTLSEYNKPKLERNYWDWSLPNPYA